MKKKTISLKERSEPDDGLAPTEVCRYVCVCECICSAAVQKQQASTLKRPDAHLYRA